jgi:hypothetical protein
VPITVPTTPTTTTPTDTTTPAPTTGTTTTGYRTDPYPAVPGTVPLRDAVPGEPAYIATRLETEVQRLSAGLTAVVATVGQLTPDQADQAAQAFDPTIITALTARVVSLETDVAALKAALLPPVTDGFGLGLFGLAPFGGPVGS